MLWHRTLPVLKQHLRKPKQKKNCLDICQSKDCGFCNEVGMAGLTKKAEIKKMLDKKYIFYPTTAIPPHIQPDTGAYYFPKAFFGMIILNDAGNFITVNQGTRNTNGY